MWGRKKEQTEAYSRIARAGIRHTPSLAFLAGSRRRTAAGWFYFSQGVAVMSKSKQGYTRRAFMVLGSAAAGAATLTGTAQAGGSHRFTKPSAHFRQHMIIWSTPVTTSAVTGWMRSNTSMGDPPLETLPEILSFLRRHTGRASGTLQQWHPAASGTRRAGPSLHAVPRPAATCRTSR